ncbi:signal peptide peptidase SppA [Desulfohalovibrio reitneri]|uniref:signal peptide peptidase SppA n=1 Tax=Desulfohalovibrio reitneri TaxID=1307759 RepID=UPI0004A6F0A3|nr:signal peptide peptidase SppA [Desulfohalovibrio reitneri]
MKRRPPLPLLLVLALSLLAASCSTKVKVFDDYTDPLREVVLRGDADEKVLLLPIRGVITHEPDRGVFTTRPGTVQEVAAHLKKARKDPEIKAVVLTVNSPGGGVTASDVIHHQLTRFKEETGKKLVVCMLDVAASGGYYVSLPADRIYAHPTTVTGSVGTIFIQPQVAGLLDKLGVEVRAYTSGEHKDMGSPFRHPSPEEQRIFQDLIDEYSGRFLELVAASRPVKKDDLTRVADARIFTARQAQSIGLVDEIGFLEDALDGARTLAGLPDDARVVAYRRTVYADDTAYNPVTSGPGGRDPRILDLGPAEAARNLQTGFHHLWLPQAR